MFAMARFAPESIWLTGIRLPEVEVSHSYGPQSCFSRGVDGLPQNHSHAGLAGTAHTFRPGQLAG